MTSGSGFIWKLVSSFTEAAAHCAKQQLVECNQTHDAVCLGHRPFDAAAQCVQPAAPGNSHAVGTRYLVVELANFDMFGLEHPNPPGTYYLGP